MELNIDLLRKSNKHWFSLIWGTAMLIITAVWFADRKIENLPISTFDWIYQLLIILFGVWLVMTGLGYHARKFFGNAFIRIDAQLITFKTGIMEKEESVSWQEIKSIQFKYNKFRITKVDDTVQVLRLPYTNSTVSNEAIHAIVLAAKEKAIKIS